MFTSSELRELYIEFFKERGHRHIPSAPLIPPDDPTLLFTTAGMVQFKPLWAGTVDPLPYTRSTTVQKCFRAGGKGSDLENVGKTLRHLTFFEMLGNFSFGDYFKREAIQWAWEFCTVVLKIPPDRLYASVHKDDDEAFEIWHKEIGLATDRIVSLGDEDNFWGPAGETGACGPCSELYVDMGEERSCGKPNCTVGCDCDRFLEFWNMVFPQYFQQMDGTRIPLKNRGIDTGMGLERLACVVQNKDSLFETDLLYPIVSAAADMIGVDYKQDRRTTLSLNVVTDHIRGLVFVISEGVTPSNEGRGYVLRRVLRRAVRHYKKLGLNEPAMFKLVDVVVDLMGNAYPEITSHPEQVKKIIRFEEERFHKTLSLGMELLEGLVAKVKKCGEKDIPGEEVFRLYDTYGFPVELTKEIATEEGVGVDLTGFEKCLEEQKCVARAAWKGGHAFEKLDALLEDVVKQYGATRFSGYERFEDKARIMAIFDSENRRIERVECDMIAMLVLDKTPFYGEAGGQVGDTGTLTTDTAIFDVKETERTPADIFIHIGEVRQGSFNVGDTVTARIDKERRLAIMRHHTVTHLLQGALKRIVGTHITQSGSMVHPEHLRFDFTHIEALTPEQLYRVERMVNEKIAEDIATEVMVLPLEEAKTLGAIAPFGEKYGAVVRVLKIGDFSMEFCGGTHLDRTGKIGTFIITGESSIAAGVRRIEAKAGMAAFEHLYRQRQELGKIAHHFNVSPEEAFERVQTLAAETKELKRELQQLKQKNVLSEVDEIIANARVVNDIKVVTHRFEGLSQEQLRNLADVIKSKLKKRVIVLLATVEPDNQKVQLICSVTSDISSEYPAQKLINMVAKPLGGGGGGRAEMAQAGGKQPEKLDDAMNAFFSALSSENK